jgi:predicted transcriptional regulator with HTH domain
MPTISKEKIEKISEQILSYLFSVFPKQVFTVDVAREIARDEEFVKELMMNLEKKGLVLRIDKNSLGTKYARRIRWRLSGRAHEVYSRL